VNGVYATKDPIWAATSGYNWNDSPSNAPTINSTPGTSATCYDNNSKYKGTMKYSLSQNNGAGMNCALSFKIQAGD
jgi:hypothetical protein